MTSPHTAPLPHDFINQAPLRAVLERLSGLYEHADWIVSEALVRRPFASLAAFELALQAVVDAAGLAAQLTLIRAHPMLTGKARIDPTIAPDSQSEQSLVGLDRCTPDEYRALHQLNEAYLARFGWPFIVAVRGPNGSGLTRQQIIDSLAQRLTSTPSTEREECLRQIHQIAHWRLLDRFQTGAEASPQLRKP